jgi:hypothetical protein
MRRFAAAALVATLAVLVLASGPAVGRGHNLYEVVILQTDHRSQVEACLGKAGRGYVHEEEEQPTSEVISTAKYSTQKAAKAALEHAPKCHGGGREVEPEE